jgi:hypothetical protein
MTIKQHGGVFGRNPTFNIATATQFVGPISGLATSAAALKSSTTTGLMQIAGPAAGQTRTMTIPDANFTAARTDAAQSFIGDQTLTDGNLIVSNGKGIDFSATAGTGTSELFDDYEEGTWTPAITYSGGNGDLSYSNQTGLYTKIGNIVNFKLYLLFNETTASGYIEDISGLPFTTSGNAGGGMFIDNMTGLTGGGQWQTINNSNVIYPSVSGTGAASVILNSNTGAASNVINISGAYRTLS